VKRIAERTGAALIGCICMGAIARDIEKGGGKGSAGKLLFETTLEMMGCRKLEECDSRTTQDDRGIKEECSTTIVWPVEIDIGRCE